MLFEEKRSGLVRLSDCVKIGLLECQEESVHIIKLYSKHAEDFLEMRRIAELTQANKLSPQEADEELRRIVKDIPENDAYEGAFAQNTLHSKALSVLLNCCLCLESYINSLAYHLFREIDFLGLIRSGHDITAEILSDSIERMGTLSKWDNIGKIKNGIEFDKSKSPFQDLKILFNFRNDIVHDKAVEYDESREKTRYGGKLPDPISGFLDLSHAVFAASTYWEMVLAVHSMLGLDLKAFHKHYNLSPWFNEEFRVGVYAIAEEYNKTMRKGDMK